MLYNSSNLRMHGCIAPNTGKSIRPTLPRANWRSGSGCRRSWGSCFLNRGISDFENAQAFLRPSLLALADPNLLPGLSDAAQRIAGAIRDREKIVIYGDYDVDGITATSILWHAITLLGGVVETYIPHRIDEGYGLNSEALGQIIDAGAKLIVTVDCGITAIEPARIARSAG